MQNRHVLTILSEWYQNVMTYGHLMTENWPYKPLYFRPGALSLAPGSKYSALIGTMSVFNCLYFGHYISNGAEICQYKLFQAAFSEFKTKITIF